MEIVLSNSHQRYTTIGCDPSPRPNHEKVAAEAQEPYFHSLRPRFYAHVHAGGATDKRLSRLYDKQHVTLDSNPK
jgi:hypothetical protein